MPKTCIRCLVDCSNIRRVKDSDGRYMCGPCFDAAQKTASMAPESVAAGPAPTRPASAPARSSASARSEQLDSAEIPEFEPIDLEPEWQQPTLDHCPACSVEVRPGALVCVSCGARLGNVQTLAPAGVPTRKPCKKCGYDLSGVPGTRCPECNTKNPIAAPEVIERDEHDLWMEKAVVWEAYRKPIAAFVTGVIIMMGLAAAWYGPQGALFFLIALPITWIIGTIGYFVVGMIMGFLDSTLAITLTQTAAITALGLAATELCFHYASGVVYIGIRPLLLVAAVITLATVGVTDDDDKINCFFASLPITIACLAVPFLLLAAVQ